MAEEKKPEKTSSSSGDPFADIVWGLLAIFVLIYLINGIFSVISSSKMFSSGWNGLSLSGVISSHTRPINSLLNPIGAKIVSTKNTDIYDSPNGKKIGSHKIGDKGKILEGPVEINGERWWYVDYDPQGAGGPDGWVKESDIAYLESEPNFIERLWMSFLGVLTLLKVISFLVCILLIIFIIYLFRGINKLRENEIAMLYPEALSEETPEINPKWKKIIDHIESQNENDWRLAIIECDIILDELLDKISPKGETIGDKLKNIEKSDFTTIDDAWEAHKIRNQIAHEGSEFILTQREARRVVELYRKVFEEFEVI